MNVNRDEADTEDTVKSLVQEAVLHNRAAKQSAGREKVGHYKRKGEIVSTLILLNRFEIDEVQIKGGRPVIGLVLGGSVPLHVLPSQLSKDALDVLERDVLRSLRS